MTFIIADEEIGFAPVLARIVVCRQGGGDDLFRVRCAEVEIDHFAGPKVPFKLGGIFCKFVIVPIVGMLAGDVKPDDGVGIERPQAHRHFEIFDAGFEIFKKKMSFSASQIERGVTGIDL